MPELPEVEVIRRGLDKALVGRSIRSIELLCTRSFPGYDGDQEHELIGATVQHVRRRGKLLLIALEALNGEDLTLMIHLRMTGQLIFRPAARQDGFSGGFPSQSLIAELPDKSTRVIVVFSDGSQLFFNDQRKFGYWKLLPSDRLSEDEFLAQLGPEPLAEDFDWRALRQALSGTDGHKGNAHVSTRPVKAALLDQHAIAGVGNIYADESLFRARIDPRRPVSSLTVPEYKRLLEALKASLSQSIADGGSTARNYVDAEGLRGEYLDLHASVYGRVGQPCPRCGRPLEKIRVAGRGTTICTHCQK